MAPASPVATVVVLATALGVLTGLALAWYTSRYGEHPVSNRFAQLMFVDAMWALLYLLQLLSPTDDIVLLLDPFKSIAAMGAAVFWFLFVVEYTGDSAWLPDWFERALWAEVIGYWVLRLVNPAGIVNSSIEIVLFDGLRLPRELFGPLAVVQIFLLFVLLVATFVLLGRFFLQTGNLYRKQTGLIFLSTLVVVVGNAVYFSGYAPHPSLDITSQLFIVQSVGVFVALFRYDFLNVAPMAADTLLKEMSDPVFVVDHNYQLVEYNEAASRYVPEDSGSKIGLADVQIDGLDTVCRDGLLSDGGAHAVTTLENDETTKTVTYDVRLTPIRDHFEEIRGSVLVLRDVSERKAREQTLERQNERLEEFAHLLSHDLRNPLSVIDGHLELAAQTGDLQNLEQARAATERMETLIDDLLTVAKDGTTIEETERVDIDELAEAAWKQVDTAEATLTIDTAMRVYADRSRLQQAFENLFRNAVENGTPPVEVEVGEFAEGFYIADNGPGIPVEKRETVFDMGYSTASDGTGFGLAIVERIVDAHGWQIALTDSERGGARFEITDLYARLDDV